MNGWMDGWGKNNNKTKEADDSLIMHTHTAHKASVGGLRLNGASHSRRGVLTFFYYF